MEEGAAAAEATAAAPEDTAHPQPSPAGTQVPSSADVRKAVAVEAGDEALRKRRSGEGAAKEEMEEAAAGGAATSPPPPPPPPPPPSPGMGGAGAVLLRRHVISTRRLGGTIEASASSRGGTSTLKYAIDGALASLGAGSVPPAEPTRGADAGGGGGGAGLLSSNGGGMSCATASSQPAPLQPGGHAQRPSTHRPPREPQPEAAPQPSVWKEALRRPTAAPGLVAKERRREAAPRKRAAKGVGSAPLHAARGAPVAPSDTNSASSSNAVAKLWTTTEIQGWAEAEVRNP